jgi:hypothetical protein
VHTEPSHWLHEISISKTVRHHFWPGLKMLLYLLFYKLGLLIQLKFETVIFLTAEILPIKSEKMKKRKERSIRVSITRCFF